MVLFSNQGDTDVPATETPPTTLAGESEAAATITPAEALNMANAFYVAANSGDPDEELALFSPDATFASNFTGSVSTEDTEMLVVWNAAQGTKVTSEGCSVAPTAPAPSLTVICEGETSDALSKALAHQSRGVPTRVSMVVASDGIEELEYRYGQPDFTDKGIPFENWMRIHNPNDAEAAAGFGTWTTVEEAREFGLLRAQYAREWAEYLKQNRCTYRDAC